MELRTVISELFGAHPPERVILGPGILIGLQILFANLGIRHLALTTEEYYRQEHFPALDAEAFSIESFVRRVETTKPEAVLASVVTWRGRDLQLYEMFNGIRSALGNKAPILIADYSHAGAVGFPKAAELNADIVCGDPAKWVLPQTWASRLAFFWFRSGDIFEAAKKAFGPFFLAIPERGNQFFARWIDPQEVRITVSSIKERELDRATLLRRHRDNLSLTAELSTQLEIDCPPETSIIWLDKERMDEMLPTWLMKSRLVWNPLTGGMRILCRAETKDDKE